MHTYAFIVANDIDMAKVSLPAHIGVHTTHPLSDPSRVTVLVTGGARIEDGIAAVMAVYPDAQATLSREQASVWLKNSAERARVAAEAAEMAEMSAAAAVVAASGKYAEAAAADAVFDAAKAERLTRQ